MSTLMNKYCLFEEISLSLFLILSFKELRAKPNLTSKLLSLGEMKSDYNDSKEFLNKNSTE
ncbi:hypothetical protein BLOT_011742 [Blomia tropicalis]|nr:hypothetical protein BLOT_011742 [Blomia tropicalis]